MARLRGVGGFFSWPSTLWKNGRTQATGVLSEYLGRSTGHVYNCAWFQVSDIIEAISAHFHKEDEESYKKEKAPTFEKELNDFFVRKGIGWQFVDGLIVTRGAEAFERAVRTARATLEAGKRPTARTHIDEALGALSGRPSPNLPGAIYHAMGCLEGCVATL
jgi:hypothetical protein